MPDALSRHVRLCPKDSVGTVRCYCRNTSVILRWLFISMRAIQATSSFKSRRARCRHESPAPPISSVIPTGAEGRERESPFDNG